MSPKAILIGNSDGIGLATTGRLLEAGWEIIGISRSESPVANPDYRHYVADVGDAGYSEWIAGIASRGRRSKTSGCGRRTSTIAPRLP